MRIDCPHCKNPLDIVPEDVDPEATQCPSCGSRLPQFESTIQKVAAGLFQPGELIGQYQLLEIVGRGQFGTVWKARDTRLDRIVALKLPRHDDSDGANKALFLREARAATAVQHPHIVTVYAVDEIDGQVFIASEFIEGCNLKQKLAQERMAFPAVAQLLSVVADAVHKAHQAGVTHRDLKPANILVNTEGKPYVSDFGLAKQDSAEITMTVSGMILGTPAYMSPEQARGENRAVDRRSDVYSLGVILYELLTGQKPFSGSSNLLLLQIQSRDPRAPRSIEMKIPRDLETICLMAMEKSPDRRYQTASAMADDLKRYLNGEPLQARPVSQLGRLWRRARRNPAFTVSVLVAGISLGVATVLASSRIAASRNLTPPVVEKEQEQVFALAFPSTEQSDFFRKADADGPMVVRSTAHRACIQMGKPQTASYAITMKAGLEHDHGIAGIALGIHQTSVAPAQYRCQLLYVRHYGQDGLRLILEDCDIAIDGFGKQSLIGRMQLASVKLEQSTTKRFDLSASVQNGVVGDIQFNGLTISDPALTDVPVTTPSGAYGVVAMSHVFFYDVNFEDL